MTTKAEIRDGFKFRGGSPALDLANERAWIAPAKP